jgi:hypothetical protein
MKSETELEDPWGGVETFATHNRRESRWKTAMHGIDGVLWVLLQLLGHANTQTVIGSHPLVFESLRMLRLLFDYVCCRSVMSVSQRRKIKPSKKHTEEPLYSSNSLSSSSISVYATLMCEIGRSSDDRAVKADEKKDCVFARWNISTPGSSGVMGVMACYRDISTALVIV